VAYYKISHHLPQLHASKKAIRIAIRDIGYCRRIALKIGFSDDPGVIKERLDLATARSIWPWPNVQRICFTDEV
jgi:hypothetical protein